MERGSKGRYEKVPPSLLACHELPRHGLSSSLFRSPSAARSRQWPCGMMPLMAEHSGRGGVILDAAGEPVQRDRRHPGQGMTVSPFSVPLEVDLKRTETFREGEGQGGCELHTVTALRILLPFIPPQGRLPWPVFSV